MGMGVLAAVFVLLGRWHTNKGCLPESEWSYVEDMFWPFSKRSTQPPMTDSHIGGEVTLPDSVANMRCVFCKALMPLFFKMELSHTRAFQNHSLLVFACVACVHEDKLIPQMLKGPLKGVEVSSDFLRSYQTNFRCLILPKNELAMGTKINPAVKLVTLEPKGDGKVYCGKRLFGQVGGKPKWVLGDESPGLCDGERAFEFVLQLSPHWMFETLTEAPRQMELNLTRKPVLRDTPGYDLFIGNTVYFFAVPGENDLVYVITQVD